MRIERIVARAFGPFRDEELHLAPGMTVIAGPNEAGKSTWHAALRLALTGLRRGKGPGTAAERQLAERHRPWDQPERWEVEARLQLADGRTVEVRQDLAGKVDCRAVDVGLGRDVSDEILDGTPDASRWLGLDRDSFAATVSVSQAQVLAVADAADQLQEQMQRAAATRGADATAAEAIARLEQFRRDAVGADRIGARGPLRGAKDRLAALEARLAEVRQLHEEFLNRSADGEAAERRVLAAREAVRRAEAALAAARARQVRHRHAAAAELAARHAHAPEALTARDELADEVAGAIDAWLARPAAAPLSGLETAELQRQLAALPAPPTGDSQPHASVREAIRELDRAEAALEMLPAEAATSDLPAGSVQEPRLRELARRLRIPQLPAAAGLEAELHAARGAAAGARRPLARAALASGALLLLSGAVLFSLDVALPGIAVLVIGALVGAWGWSAGAASRRATARLARAEAALAPYREARALADEDRARAAVEAGDLGLPSDPVKLDALADALVAAAAARRSAEERERQRAALEARRAAAGRALVDALTDRGEAEPHDPRAGWQAYEAACRQRAEQGAAAARRELLEHQLEARRAAEESLRDAAAIATAAEGRLRRVGQALGLQAEAPDALVEALRDWQRRRAASLSENQHAIVEWERLQTLLDGQSLEDLAHLAGEADRAAGRLAAEVGGPVDEDGEPAVLEARLSELRGQLQDVASEADALRGSMDARRETLPDVAEAEEAVLAARVELDRVLRLADTLDRTVTLLRGAEERVHRNLAPILASSIARWLPDVSRGAYADVSVDPANLAVRVKERDSGHWREARLLSEGTREQIYLLLRVAMAEHLVTNGEVAPLLLDEVTVQSDAGRKRQLLEVLHRLSADRQVILFTHDDDVMAWAAERLTADRDATVHLSGRGFATLGPPALEALAPLAAE